MKFLISLQKNINEAIDSNELKQYRLVDDNSAVDNSCEIFENDKAKIYFFGKIYNYNKLKEAYTDVIDTPSLIVKIYQKLYYAGFKLLDGEFTFFIKDKENNKFLVYRDRHGAGSQVYFTNDTVAYNQKMLTKFNNVSLEPNFNNIALFLKHGYIPAPDTALKNVWKLPGGNVLEFKNNSFEYTELYGFNDFGLEKDKITISETEATQEFERLHKEALKSRVENSSSVQLLLSGGYDSGGNIAGLRDVYSGKAISYSIGFKDNPWSELPLAKLMSKVYDTSHYEYEIDGSEIENLPEIINNFGDPFNESGMMVNYTAMRLVNEKNEDGIILGGDGNDQHFGTAGRELALHYKYKKNGMQIAQKFVDSFAEMPIFNKDNKFFKIRFHNEKVLNILKNDSFGFRESQISKMLNTHIDISNPSYINALPNKFNSFNDLYNIHNYFGDIKQVINEVILFKASKLAVMYNNNLTFPYMSTELYNFLKTLPREVKLKGSIDDCASGKGKSKFLHKNYLYPKLPKEITERKKQGGFAPLPIFFKDTTRFNRIVDIILNSSLTKKYLNRAFVEDLLNNYRLHKDNAGYWFWYKQVQAFQIFNLITIVVWWESVIEKKDIKTLSDL